VLHPTASRPELMTRTEFEEIWDGRLILTGSQNVADQVLRAVADVTVRGRELVGRASEALMRARDTMMRARDTLMAARFGERSDMAVQSAGSESEIVSAEPGSGDESGLVAVAILLRCHGIAADPGQIRHRMGAARLGVTEILRVAKEFGLKARARRVGTGLKLLRCRGSRCCATAAF
jgi:ATP-binding cassette, subfamily B, bacterial HlyB/CyaB